MLTHTILTGFVVPTPRWKNNFILLMQKIYIFIFLFLLSLVGPIGFVGGEETITLNNYSDIEKMSSLALETGSFPTYILYITYLLIAVGIAVSIISLIGGGLAWMTSVGNPIKTKEGKERIISAIIGLVIVLSSFLFLSAINPELIEIEEPDVVETVEFFPPGIYLSKKETIPDITGKEDLEKFEEDIHRTTFSLRNLEEKGVGVKTLRIANHLDEKGNILNYYYGVVLHEDRAFRGRCEFFLNDTPKPIDFSVSGENISSVTVMRINKNPSMEGYVDVYEKPDFDDNFSFESLDLFTNDFLRLSVPEVWSIDIKGNYGIILSSGGTWEQANNGCGVFLDFKPIPDLKGHHMNKCSLWSGPPWFSSYKSCATHYAVFPLLR